mgnify:CR=1 FL=1
MKKWRKIYLYIFAVIYAGMEVANGVIGYLDRGTWFAGVASLVFDIWFIPAILGILCGIFEASDCFEKKDLPVFEFSKNGFKKLGFSTLRALGISLFHGLLSPIIFIFSLDQTDAYLEMAGVMLLWSLGVGTGAFLIVYVLAKHIIAAAREIKKSYKTLKLRKEPPNAD